MPTLASISPLPQPTLVLPRHRASSAFFLTRRRLSAGFPLGFRRARFVASSARSFDDLDARGRFRPTRSKNSIISNMIQEIEPLDVSLIQKDVPVNTVDAMKRTISSMLGLLPSNQFRVLVEAFWEPLSKLLVSSMMTGAGRQQIDPLKSASGGTEGADDGAQGGSSCRRACSRNSERSCVRLLGLMVQGPKWIPSFRWDSLDIEIKQLTMQFSWPIRMEGKADSGIRYTLRNAEYRLCLERNLDIHDELSEKPEAKTTDDASHNVFLDGTTAMFKLIQRNDLSNKSGESEEEPHGVELDIQGLGKMTPEVQKYILHLQSHLSAVEKEMHDIKRQNAALQMQHFVGEEKNDLLDYLRSLQPEKVAELSEPACPELRETIHSIVHGLLATLSPKMQTKAPPLSENASSGALNLGKDDCAELVENTSLHFQPLISVSRDYLARLLFWCMLLGHHIRGLEYRLELMELLTFTPNVVSRCEDEVAGE